jgi:hypothetical protein
MRSLDLLDATLIYREADAVPLLLGAGAVGEASPVSDLLCSTRRQDMQSLQHVSLPAQGPLMAGHGKPWQWLIYICINGDGVSGQTSVPLMARYTPLRSRPPTPPSGYVVRERVLFKGVIVAT